MSKGMSLFLTVTLLVVVAAVGMTGANKAKNSMDTNGKKMEDTANTMVSNLNWNTN